MNLLELGLQKLDSENKEFHILSDTNCDFLHKIPDNNTKRLRDILQLFLLKQTITDCTRVTSATKTLIDHHITNDERKLLRSGVLDICISDHNMIYAIRKNSIPRGPPKIIEIRSYKRFNNQAFITDLEKQKWEDLSFIRDPNIYWRKWLELFMEILDKHAPLHHKKIRNKSAPWLTQDIKRAMLQRNHFKKVSNRSGDPADWDKYESARNQVNLAIKKGKSEFFRGKIESNVNNPKDMWKVLNELTARKKKTNTDQPD